MKPSHVSKLLLLFALLTLSVTVFAGVPQKINYQGYLTTTGGAPATGPLGMTFSLYSSNPARNNPVWRETQPAVAVTNGIYNVQLGSVTPVSASFDVPYWLGVQVGADPEMSLQPLSSVPYALRTGLADSALQATVATTALQATVADTALQATVADNAARISGQTISQLDSRYVNATQPNPTAQQVAMMRWDQVRGGNGTYMVGSDPMGLTYDGSSVWVANFSSGNVMKINPATGAVSATIAVDSGPVGLSYDGSSIWVASMNGNSVTKINPATGALSGPFLVGGSPMALAFDGSNLWVANYGENNVMKIDPATGTPGAPIAVGSAPAALAFDGSSIWVANSGDNTVMKIDPASGTVGQPITVGSSPMALAFDGSSIWTANYGDNTIMKIDPAAGTVGAPITVGNSPYALAYDGRSIWVANLGSQNVMKIDPASGEVSSPIGVGNWPISLVFDGSNIWVANYFDSSVTKLAAAGLPTGAQSVTTASLVDGAVTDAKIVGPISDSKLSGNVALLDSAQSFTAAKTFLQAPVFSNPTGEPFTVTSTSQTMVTNLNADLLDGRHGSYYLDSSNLTGIIPPASGGTGINTATALPGSLLKTTGTGTWGLLPAGAEGQILKITAGQPVWGSDISGSGTVTSITAGSGLTGGTITDSGTIAIDTAVVPRLGVANTFTAGNQTIRTGSATAKGLLVQGDASQSANLQEWQNSGGTAVASVSASGVFSGDGSGLTNVAASSIADGAVTDIKITGPISDGKLSTNVALLNAPQTFSAAKTFSTAPSFSASAGEPFSVTSPTLVTNLNADLLDGLSSSYYLDSANLVGALSDARLSPNVALLNAPQTFSAVKTFANGNLALSNAAGTFSTILTAPNATVNRAFSFPDTAAGTVITTSNLNNIIQVGNVTSGTWNSTVISPLRGGTGLNTSGAGAGSLLRTTTSGTWGVLAPGGEGSVLKMSAGLPVWGTDSSNPGTVTSITAGSGLTGGTITGSGTIAIDTAVVPQLSTANTFTAGTQTIQTGDPATLGAVIRGADGQLANLQEWQSSTRTPVASVSATGVFTGDGSGLTNVAASTIADGAVTDAKISGVISSAKLSSHTGDVTGAHSATTVTAIQGRAVSNTQPLASDTLRYNGTAWAPAADVTGVTAGSGLTGGGTSGNVTVSADLTPSGGTNGTATTVARGDHRHVGPVFASFDSSAYVSIGAACTNYASVTITVPAAGTVSVEATTWLILNHAIGTDDRARISIGSTPFDCNDVYGPWLVTIPSGIETTYMDQTAAPRRVFKGVAAGTYTYYLNGIMTSGADASDVFNWGRMSATYYPN